MLIPGLLIAGLGGSLPTLFRQEGQNDYINVFDPYPYADEASYTAAVQNLWKVRVDPFLASGEATQVVLMTHDGPQDSATCNANRTIPNPSVGFHRFGSAGLARLVKEKEDSLVVHIHGHCHDGAFVDRVEGSKFQVINPGSLA